MNRKSAITLALLSVFALSTHTVFADDGEKGQTEKPQLIAEGDEQKKEGDSQLIAEGDEQKKEGESQLIA